jgi:ABC-type uncharacterized transport system permease subunit
MPAPWLFILDALAYFVLAAVFWPGRGICCKPTAANRLLPLLPLVPHLLLLGQDLLAPDAVRLGFASSLSAVAAVTVLAYSGAAWRYPLGGLLGFVMLFAGLAVGLHGLMADSVPIAHSQEPLFRLHLLMALAAYGLFTIAALHAGLIALAEKHLHRAVPPKMVADLPPLLTLEKLLFRMIQIGFALLTLTLLTGILFAEDIFGQPFPFNHKTVFGISSWLIFGALLAGRWKYGWRGRTAIAWTLTGFVTLVLAYVGVKFVLEVVLHR